MSRSTAFLLDHQFVVSDLIPEHTYKVVRGTGMGLRHSGAVANASFLTLVEHDFVTDSMEDRLHISYGISHYCRFKDDSFFIAEHRSSGMELFQLWQRRGGRGGGGGIWGFGYRDFVFGVLGGGGVRF